MPGLATNKDMIAGMLGQETAGMAERYARNAQLDRKLAGVVEAIDEHLTGTKMSELCGVSLCLTAFCSPKTGLPETQ